MKKFIVITASLLLCSSLFAQEWASISNGKVGHESYLTNDWRDNIYVGISGGISTRFTTGPKSDIRNSYVDPALNIYIMKWFTPRIGARFGYLGISGREGLNYYQPYQINHSPLPYKVYGENDFCPSSSKPGVLHYGSFQLNGDLMWNLMNTFSAFKRDRFYELSLYASGGYLRVYDNKTENKGLFSKYYDREFVLGAGIYNTFRITDRIFATADLRYSNHASRYRTDTGVRTSAIAFNIGVAYNIYRTHWTNLSTVKATVDEAKDAQAAAEKKVKETQAANTKLKKKVVKLEDQIKSYEVNASANLKPEDISTESLKARAAKADLVVYYYINQATLNFSEAYHIRNYAKEVLEKNPDHVFKITGSADKGTGTEETNAQLSKNRALFIKDILMKEFGVKEENIIISTVITDKHVDGALDRCALIEK